MTYRPKLLTSYDEPVDILRMIINKNLTLPEILLINGHGQIGKSTFLFYLFNRIKQHQNGVPLSKATWHEWDYKKYCTTTPEEFVEIYDASTNECIALEEAGEQMNYLDWFGIMGRVFSSFSNTQGILRNISALITPHAIDILKHQRECVDFKIWVRYRNDAKRLAIVRPRYIKIDYLRDKYKLGFILDWIIQYSPDFLKASCEYTDWLKCYKKDIRDDWKAKVKAQLERKRQKAEMNKTPDDFITPFSVKSSF